MLVKRTSKNQFTLPKAFLKAAGIGNKDTYFDAEYDVRQHIIFLKPVKVVIEESLSDETLERFEKQALKVEERDKVFKSREEADHFLRQRAK